MFLAITTLRFYSRACYVDDLLIYNNDWKSHIEQLGFA